MRATGRPTIEVLTRVPTLESVEVLLGAWAEVMAQPNSVGLLRERVAGARVQPTVPKPPIEDAPRGSTAVDELWIVPAPVGWITGEMDLIFAAYRELRDRLDPDQSLKHALVTALDRDSWQRLTEFFDGDKDVVYGEGAGEQARIAIRDALEHRLAPATGS